jgi:molybdopterin-guanine dinucleotide biosynthesis protein A
MHARSENITWAVLAGGEGIRMGRPKGDLEINGLPILRYLLQRVDWRGPRLLVTAPGRERPPAHYDFDREVVDPSAGLGPLRGVLTAIEAAETETVVVSTVDMPGIRCDQLLWLASALLDDPARVGVMLRRGFGHETRIEPFPSAFRRSAATDIRQRLSAGKSAVHSLASLPQFAALAVPEHWGESTWLNLNFPGDVTAFIRQMAAVSA